MRIGLTFSRAALRVAVAGLIAIGGWVDGARAQDGQHVEPRQTAALPTPPSRAAMIDLRFGRHPDKTRVVIELSQRANFDVRTTASPPAVIVELGDIAPGTGAFAEGPGVGLIDRYRQEASTSGRRMVFFGQGPVRPREVFMIPPRDGRQSRLVIDIEAGAPVETPAAPSASQGGRIVEAALRPAAKPPAARESQRRATLIVPTPDNKPKRAARKPLVVLDPGHGGVDPGALGVGGVHEKDITLAAAREVRRQLLASGRYQVKMTRDADVFIRLRDRVAIAREAEADMFISLHADIIGSENIRGLSIYTLSHKASDREAEMLAAKENRADAIGGIDLSAENDQVASILIDLAQRDTMNHSKRFATLALGELKRDVRILAARPHREAGFAVLTAPDVPSVLMEMGYLSNATDASLLNSNAYREKLGRDITRALDLYFKALDRR